MPPEAQEGVTAESRQGEHKGWAPCRPFWSLMLPSLSQASLHVDPPAAENARWSLPHESPQGMLRSPQCPLRRALSPTVPPHWDPGDTLSGTPGRSRPPRGHLAYPERQVGESAAPVHDEMLDSGQNRNGAEQTQEHQSIPALPPMSRERTASLTETPRRQRTPCFRPYFAQTSPTRVVISFVKDKID